MRKIYTTALLLLAVLQAIPLSSGYQQKNYLDLDSGNTIELAGAKAAALLEVESNTLLYHQQATLPLPAASTAKIATLYWSQVKAEIAGLAAKNMITISPAASSNQRPAGSVNYGLHKGDQQQLQTLLRATAVISAADTSYALADYFGPGSDNFVRQLNAMAQLMGLDFSYLADVDGWSAQTKFSALDLIHLSNVYLQYFPNALTEYHQIAAIKIANGTSKNNTNNLIGKYRGADGIKTGFTYEAGFNQVSTASRNNRRLIAVVLGIHSDSIAHGLKLRAAASAKLLDYGFNNFSSFQLKNLPALQIFKEKQSVSWQLKLINPTTLTRRNQDLDSELYRLVLWPDQQDNRNLRGNLFFYDQGGKLRQQMPVILQTEQPKHLVNKINVALLNHQRPLLRLLNRQPLNLTAID